MPLEKLAPTADCIWGFWKIEEEETFFAKTLEGLDHVPENIVHPHKRLEYLAARHLLKHFLDQWGFAYEGIIKNEFGKPYLRNQTLELSFSHSFPYVAVVIHRHQRVGIDLEQPKEKLLRVAARVLSPDELAFAGSDVITHCILWSAKEAMIKIHGKKDLTMATQLLVEPFKRVSTGQLIGRIVANEVIETVPLQYHVYNNFVVVLNS